MYYTSLWQFALPLYIWFPSVVSQGASRFGKHMSLCIMEVTMQSSNLSCPMKNWQYFHIEMHTHDASLRSLQWALDMKNIFGAAQGTVLPEAEQQMLPFHFTSRYAVAIASPIILAHRGAERFPWAPLTICGFLKKCNNNNNLNS